jgi:SAM-dependent methyltransferase
VSDHELVNELSASTTPWVDPSNLAQLAAWDGDAGAYWAVCADRFDEGVAGYRDQFLAAAAIDTTAKVLDVGCGSGQATRDAARCATAGSALGVDLSSRMIELARQRANREQVPNVTFHQADAQVHPFPDHGFTIVISRHGAMFFRDAPTAFTNIARAMSPGGRPCTSAPIPTTPSNSSPASTPQWCATSTPTPEAERSTTCEPAWAITRPNEACTTTQQPGSSRRDVADTVSRREPPGS